MKVLMKSYFLPALFCVSSFWGCIGGETTSEINTNELEEGCADSTFANLLDVGRTEEDWTFEYQEYKKDSLYLRQVFIVDSFHDSLEIYESMWTSFGLDSIFTKAEIDGYKNLAGQIEKECLPGYKFISEDSLRARKEIDRAAPGYEVLKYYSFSRPLISANQKIALMEINYYCGHHCGGASTYLFISNSGKWQILRSYGRWVS